MTKCFYIVDFRCKNISVESHNFQKVYSDFLQICSTMAYWKTWTWDPTGILAGPHKNRKTETRDTCGTLVGPYQYRKTDTQDLSGTLAGPSKNQENQHLGP